MHPLCAGVYVTCARGPRTRWGTQVRGRQSGSALAAQRARAVVSLFLCCFVRERALPWPRIPPCLEQLDCWFGVDLLFFFLSFFFFDLCWVYVWGKKGRPPRIQRGVEPRIPTIIEIAVS
jgi:hypothetical protein